MICPICKNETTEASKYCTKCGKQIPRCPTCNMVIRRKMRFCSKDGTLLPEEMIAALPDNRETASAEAETSAKSEKGHSGAEESKPVDTIRKKKKRILPLLLVLAFVALAGILGYCFASGIIAPKLFIRADTGADAGIGDEKSAAAEELTAGAVTDETEINLSEEETAATDAGSTVEESSASEDQKKDDEAGSPNLTPKATSVTFACLYGPEKNTEYGLISGISSLGETVWQIRTEDHLRAQLDSVSEIGSCNDIYCYSDDGTVIAVNIADGSEVWRNSEFGGYACHGAFGKNGVLYLCGYFGPHLMVIDSDGSTIRRINSFDPDYFWPFSIAFQTDENCLAIEFEATPSGETETVYVSLDDWSTSIENSSGSSDTISDPMQDIAQISASSYLDEPQYNITHSPANVSDGNPGTAWVEGVSGTGEGESITITLNSEHEINGFTINAGYQKSDGIYSKNARPKAITVTFGGSDLIFQVTLTDTNGKQTVEFRGPVATDSVTITIDSVYDGSIYQDTAISEICLY